MAMTMDRISQLPESLMLQILSLLSPKDACRMSSLSRAWYSLPVSYLGFKFDSEEERFGIDCEGKRSPHQFPTFVSESMSILHQLEDQHEGRKRIVDYFKLTWIVSENWLHINVNNWINLLSNHCVKHLELNLIIRPKLDKYDALYYFPPPRTLENLGSSLVVLKLSRCQLNKALVEGHTTFSFLQELCLHYVDFNHQVGEVFLSRCPSLRTLDFHHCNRLNSLELYYQFRYWNLHVDSQNIEAANLQTLSYSGLCGLNLKPICATNLKRLCIRSGPRFTSKYFETLNSKFPSLVELDLSGSSSSSPELKITLRQLKSLTLSLDHLEKINLDTPSLLCYSYQGPIIKSPAITLSSLPKPKLINLKLTDTRNLHTDSLLNLRQYLANFAPNSDLSVRYRFNEVAKNVQIPLLPKVSANKAIPPPAEVQHLSLENIQSSTLNYTVAVIDCFLWICHPIRLSLKFRHPPLNIEFVKLVCEELMFMVESQQCCGGSHFKGWKHYVKSVKIQSFNGKRDGQLVDSVECSLTDLGKVQELTFEIQYGC